MTELNSITITVKRNQNRHRLYVLKHSVKTQYETASTIIDGNYTLKDTDFSL